MADNTTLNTGAGGDIIATDDIAGIKHQRVKVEFGADGSATDVSSLTPLPTQTPLTSGTGSITVNGGSASFSLIGAVSCTAQISGTWVGTLIFQITADDGVTWYQTETFDPSVNESVQSSTTQNGIFTFHNATGMTHVRVLATIFTSGSAAIRFTTNQVPHIHNLSEREDNASAPQYATVVAGIQSGNVQMLELSVADPVGTEQGLIVRNVPSGTHIIGGNVAHDAVDAGNPIKMGGHARITNPVAVADADRVNAMFDKLGRLVVVNQVRGLSIQNSIVLTATTETTLLSAGAAGVFHDLTTLIITNSSSTAVRIDFRDIAAGGVIFSVSLAANGGAVITNSPIAEQSTAASAWTVQLSAAVTDVRIYARAVKNL